MAEKRYMFNRQLTVRRVYHCRLSCLIGRHPHTDSSFIVVPESLIKKLTTSHLAHIHEQFGLSPAELLQQPK